MGYFREAATRFKSLGKDEWEKNTQKARDEWKEKIREENWQTCIKEWEEEQERLEKEKEEQKAKEAEYKGADGDLDGEEEPTAGTSCKNDIQVTWARKGARLQRRVNTVEGGLDGEEDEPRAGTSSKNAEVDDNGNDTQDIPIKDAKHEDEYKGDKRDNLLSLNIKGAEGETVIGMSQVTWARKGARLQRIVDTVEGGGLDCEGEECTAGTSSKNYDVDDNDDVKSVVMASIDVDNETKGEIKEATDVKDKETSIPEKGDKEYI